MTLSEVKSINGREISDNYSRSQLLNKIDKSKINDNGTGKDELWSADKISSQFKDIENKDLVQNSTISEIKSQINSINNGYIAVDSIDKMIDNKKIYINTSDGNWYYHNGSSFVVGGVYQSTALAQESVNLPHLNVELKNKLFKYMNINCNEFSWTKEYVNNSLVIGYSNICLLSNIVNVNADDILVAKNGYEFKIVYYEGDNISSLSTSYVNYIKFDKSAKVRFQVSRTDSANISISDFLSSDNLVLSQFIVFIERNSIAEGSVNERKTIFFDNINGEYKFKEKYLKKREYIPNIFTVTNILNENYKPLGSDYIKFIDGKNKLNIIYSLWDSLATEHSEYVTKEVLGQDATGLDINVYKLTPPSKKMWMNNDNFMLPKILYISCLHGDEPNAAYSDYRFFKHLIDSYKINDVLGMLYDNVEFVVCPIANPWGYDNNNRLNSNGVNLNRNFPINWTPIEVGSNYSGATAASEKETQLIMQLIDNNADAFFLVNRHGTTTFTQGSKFGYVSSNHQVDRKVCHDLFRRLDRSMKQSFPFIENDYSYNTTRNIFGVSFSDAVGNLENYANLDKKMNGVLLELGSRTFGSDYPNGTLNDMQNMEVEVIGSLLETAVLNNNLLITNI